LVLSNLLFAISYIPLPNSAQCKQDAQGCTFAMALDLLFSYSCIHP